MLERLVAALWVVVLVAACGTITSLDDGPSDEATVASAGGFVLEAETMSLPPSSGMITTESTASGNKGLLIWSNATATKPVALGTAATRVVVRARGDRCNGAPHIALTIDGTQVVAVDVTSAEYADYATTIALAAGNHTVGVAFTNDALVAGTCDRNLYVDSISFRNASSTGGAVAPPGYAIYFDDEFDDTFGGAPNPASWDYDVDYVRNNELQCYTDNRRANVRVETRTIDGTPNGVLVLQTRKEDYACPQHGNTVHHYTSGSITSRTKHYGPPKVEMPFGHYEIRAKLPRGRGMWPAIWFVGSSSLGVWPNSGEIDLMEQVGYEEMNGLNRFYSTLHKQTANGAWPTRIGGTGMGQYVDIGEPASASFHVFAMDWEPGKLTFFVDGAIVGTRIIDYAGQPSSTEHHDSFVRAEIPNTSTPIGWPYAKQTADAQFHMIINAAYGGSWGGWAGVDDTIFAQGNVEMLVDYVRIYTKL